MRMDVGDTNQKHILNVLRNDDHNLAKTLAL